MALTQLIQPQHNDPAPVWLRAIGGRKWVLSLLTLLSATALAAVGIITGGEWITACSISAAIYGVTNAATYLSARPKLVPVHSPIRSGVASTAEGEYIDEGAG